MRTTLTRKDLTGSATNIQETYSTVVGPMHIAGARSWSVELANYGSENLFDVKLEVSNDLTETAASIVDWFDLNADIPDGSLGVVIPTNLVSNGKAFFMGISPLYVCRWVRLRARAVTDSTPTNVRAAIHAIF